MNEPAKIKVSVNALWILSKKAWRRFSWQQTSRLVVWISPVYRT